ncbi:MAG TPA: tRNA (adenosine(37)-N6)-threonylcarbamoyltransferase complex transferase subunit TsaD [Candidatus Paceibacterota bacterium]|nr:tRNA (adenosine(37)-N6)-threonylcarbamoyltransferase complex transferase subunit TsaD [Candidatus Paceibacterota bacterium]
MKLLSIETSCDETAVCVIKADGRFDDDFSYAVLGNALYSQAALHAEFGGVFPNLAKREHAKNLVPLTQKALQEAGMLAEGSGDAPELATLLAREPELLSAVTPFLATHAKPDLDAIAVTAGPGPEPALWVGINFAKALSIAWSLPLIAVNHMEGHVVMSLVDEHAVRETNFPLLALLISGGHTELVLSRTFGEYERIGETRDDAAGEAFDKVARLLDLPYPGGPEISRLAARARETGIKPDFSFTRPMLHEKNYDFSFSGLKTAVRNVVHTRELTEEFKMQVAREFEECVADVLIAKTLRAVEEFGVSTVVVGGGVSANTYIRQRLAEALAEKDASASLLVPPPSLATDNALMIALAGYFRAQQGLYADPATLAADGNLRL